jgi:hypothetical protein
MKKISGIAHYFLDRFDFLLDYYGNVTINIHLSETILFKYWKCYQKGCIATDGFITYDISI